MNHRADASLRLLRTFVLACVVLALGSVAHVWGGGLLPAWPVLAALVLACAGSAWTFLRRQVTGAALVVLVVAGQATVHLALTVTAGHAGDPGTSPGGVLPLLAGIASDLAHHTFGEPLMLLAHLAAAALAGLWLGVGERVLWTLVALAFAALLHMPGHIRTVVRPCVDAPRRTPDQVRPTVALLARDVTRRGPPKLLAA